MQENEGSTRSLNAFWLYGRKQANARLEPQAAYRREAQLVLLSVACYHSYTIAQDSPVHAGAGPDWGHYPDFAVQQYRLEILPTNKVQ